MAPDCAAAAQSAAQGTLPAAPAPTTFSLNGAVFHAADPTQTLAAFLREHTRVTSVKVGCAEGGCGACAVLVRRPSPAGGPPRVATVNACLTPVGSLHGASLLASDGLKRGDDPHPIHDALASNHASQCGFCTPGMAIACAAAAANRAASGACGGGGDGAASCALPAAGNGATISRALDGNLCRCTGYRSILDAAASITAADVEDLAGKLLPPAAVRAAAAASESGDVAPGGGAAAAWRSPPTTAAAVAAIAAAGPAAVRIVAGNTGSGVYKRALWPPPAGTTVVSLSRAADLAALSPTPDGGLALGGAATLADLGDAAAARTPDAARWGAISAHVARIAGAHVRAAATLGGNIALAASPHALESDPVTLLAAAGATVTVVDCATGAETENNVLDLVAAGPLPPTSLITRVTIPAAPPGEHYASTRVAARYSHAVASFNMAVSVVCDGGQITSAVVVFGYHAAPSNTWRAARAATVEAALTGAAVTDTNALAAALAAARDEAAASARDADFISGVAEGALAAALAPVFAPAAAAASPRAQAVLAARLFDAPGRVTGEQTWGAPRPETAPVGEPIQKDRARLQASGEAVYTSDIHLPAGGLHAAPVLSSVAAGTLETVDAAPALALPGVVAFIDASSIPPGGSNDIIGDTIFAVDAVHYVGERIGLILAETDAAARAGAAAVAITYGPPPSPPILSIADAVAADAYYDLSEIGGDGTTLRKQFGGATHDGGIDAALAAAPHRVLKATVSMPSQAHMYMEPQAAVAFPDEGGAMHVISGTQCVDMVQSAVAAALNLPAHAVIASTRRLGGGFGGKSARSQPVAAAAAVAAAAVKRPVRLVLTRAEDFAMIGGRCELEAEYDVGFDGDGVVTALAVRAVFLGGARKEISNFIPLLALNTLDQNYAFPAIDATVRLVRTNLAPRTIMRAPGTLQATLIAEAVVETVAAALNKDPIAVREANLLTHDALPDVRKPCAGELARGVVADDATSDVTLTTAMGGDLPLDQYTVPRMWCELKAKADVEGRAAAIAAANAASPPWIKRGLSMATARFVMNVDAKPAAVSLYHDGTVLIASPGHEMGQGIHTKVIASACAALSTALPPGSPHLPLSLFRVADTSTLTTPACGPSWGSTTSEASCEAVRLAALQLADAVRPKLAPREDGSLPTWREAVAALHPSVGFSASTVPFTAYAFYDGTQRAPAGAGRALTYNGCGVAVSEVTVNALTGEVRVDRADIMLDAAHSLNQAVDVGQAEGGYIQGLGLMLSEAVRWNEQGVLTTGTTWDYKVPTVDAVPRSFNVHLLERAPHARGVLSSKAVGEPPLLLAVTALHAAQAAIDAVRAGLGGDAADAQVNGVGDGVPAPRAGLTPPATPAAVKAAIGRLPLAEWVKGG